MRIRGTVAALSVSVAALLVGVAIAATPTPKRGVVTVIAHVPSPGYPAFPLVVGADIYEGTYTSASGDSIPSHVFEFSASGQLLKTFVVKGQNLSQDHGVQVATTDARGDLVLLDDTSGRVLLLNPKTGAQSQYGTVPDIPTCSADGNRSPCSQARADLTPEPDYAVWGTDGSMYLTDYQQAVIWRLPPRGGKAQVWLSSPLLDGAIFGTGGIVELPDHRTLLFDQASNADGSAGNPTTGKLYSVTIEPGGHPGTPHQLWESTPAAAPDGFALTRSGHIYVAQVGPSANDIVELSSSGKQLATFGTPVSGANGSSVPFDEPSGVSFLGTELVIANQSYAAGDTAHMALLALGTGEAGQPTYVPKDAGPPAPKKPAVKKKHRKRRRRR
jgi:sugar lactone lactonase YvrE